MGIALSDGGLSASATDYRRLESLRTLSHRLLSTILAVITDIVTTMVFLGLSFLLVTQLDAHASFDRTVWGAQQPIAVLLFFTLGCGMIILLLFRGYYDRMVPTVIALRQLFGVSFFCFFVSCPVLFWAQAPHHWRLLPGVWLIVPMMILGNRMVLTMILHRIGLDPFRVMIVGSTSGVLDLRSAIDSDSFSGLKVVAQLDLTAVQAQQQISGQTVRAYLSQGVISSEANFMVISLRDCQRQLREAVMVALRSQSIPYAIVPDLDGLPVHGCNSYYYMSHSCMMLSFRNDMQNPIARCFKGLFDRAAALVLLILLLPLLFVVALAVASDGGAVLYSQVRIGQNGRRFRCLKFRSMAMDADQRISRLLATDRQAADEWAHTQKLRDDPRITRVGGFLRRTSIDELPQLLNVLRGDMSLVGPRPVVDDEIARYGAEQHLYMLVKPGITGLWQVSGRSETTYAERVSLDAWYATNWSLWHDIVILVRTVPALLSRRGAV